VNDPPISLRHVSIPRDFADDLRVDGRETRLAVSIASSLPDRQKRFKSDQVPPRSHFPAETL
jgi:hypothetical protein